MMMSFRKRTFLCIAYLHFVVVLNACSSAVHSASSPVPSSENMGLTRPLWTNTFPPIKNNGAALRFVHYGLEEGLSQSSVLTLIQDNLGFLWIGTQDGLNRFDGYSFKVFRPNLDDLYALKGNEISAIIQSRDGALWVGTNAGLNRYDPTTGKFTHWVHDNNDPASLVCGAKVTP
jgi:hypothetical protein